MTDFVDGQRDQRFGALGGSETFTRGDDREQGVGEHDEGGVAVPGGPLADLVLVEADLAFAGLEALLDAPSGAGHPHERGQRDGLGRPAAVEGQFPVGDTSPDQQPVMSRDFVGGWLDAYPGPVVLAFAFGTLARRAPVPGAGRQMVGDVSDLGRPVGQRDPVVAGNGKDVAQAACLQVTAQTTVVAGTGRPLARCRLCSGPFPTASGPNRTCPFSELSRVRDSSETGTAGSASGLGKRTGSNPDTAPQADSTTWTISSRAWV